MSGSYGNLVVLSPRKWKRDRDRRERRNTALLQSILLICESPLPTKRLPAATRGPHHVWLETHLPNFFRGIGQRRTELHALIADHADKCYLFRERWEKEGIPFVHGVAIYLLSRTSPYDLQVTNDVESWVVENYGTFHPHLPPPDPSDKAASTDF